MNYEMVQHRREEIQRTKFKSDKKLFISYTLDTNNYKSTQYLENTVSFLVLSQ